MRASVRLPSALLTRLPSGSPPARPTGLASDRASARVLMPNARKPLASARQSSRLVSLVVMFIEVEVLVEYCTAKAVARAFARNELLKSNSKENSDTATSTSSVPLLGNLIRGLSSRQLP